MKKAIFWVTVTSGVVAAYLMWKRGVPLSEVASSAVEHPFGSLLDELKRG